MLVVVDVCTTIAASQQLLEQLHPPSLPAAS